MGLTYLLFAELEFNDPSAIAAATQELEDDGIWSSPDNLLAKTDLEWDGLKLGLRHGGSMPYSCFHVTRLVLATYARHAARGDAYAINTQDGVGEHYRPGADDADDDEIPADELDAITRRLWPLVARQ